MKFSRNILYLFYLLALFSNCVEEFNPSSQGYENLLVVESFLSNDDELFTVKLSRSTPIDSKTFIPELHAEVNIVDDTGGEYYMMDITGTPPGVYTYPYEIDTQIGKSFKIRFQTSDGNQYESSYVMMRETPEMDSVSFRHEERPTAGTEGIQIYINTHDPENNTWYYRWEWDETWMFRTRFNSYNYWEDGQIFFRKEQIHQCWKSDRSTSVELSTSKNLNVDRISDYPLLYVTSLSDRLMIKYSLNVKQYALSEESYNYWMELKKATESLGTLFDPQPSIVKGNIYNINDENELVLGYFDAATIQEERIFIHRNDLPLLRFPTYYSHCVDSTVYRNRVEEMIKQNWMLISEDVDDFGTPIFNFSYPLCIDCTLRGTNVEPDFWE